MRLLLSGLIAILTATGLLADPPFVHRTLENGLSQSSVQAIVQDRAGYLWFGTEEGLDRYDGYSFRVYRHDEKDPASLPDDLISSLFEDSQGRLWIGTQHGLCRYDPTSDGFVRIANVRDRVQSIVETPDGTLWMASDGGGLFLLAPDATAFASYLPDARFPWSSLGSYSLATVYVDHLGRLWIGTGDHGLDRFVPGKPYGSFVHYRHDPKNPGSLASDRVWGITEDHAGRLLVATYGGGLDLLDEAAGRFISVPAASGGQPIELLTTAFRDRDGSVWIGSDGSGLLKFDSERSSLAPIARRGPRVIRRIAQDRQGHLWLGTYQDGVYEMKTPREGFGFFRPAPSSPTSLGDSPISSLEAVSQDEVWVGTEHGEIDRFDPGSGRFTRYAGPAMPQQTSILALHRDVAGRNWAGLYHGGLLSLDTGASDLGSAQIWAIADAGGGELWLATDNGLLRYDPAARRTVRHFAPQPGENPGELSVRALLPDSDGSLWIGTFAGLARLPARGTEWQRFPSGPSSPVAALHRDDAGRIWAGTIGAGLVAYDRGSGTFATYRHFPSNVIYSIQEQPAGILWLSTNQGLVRFDAASHDFVSYDLTNGLQTLQFRLGAGARLANGQLLFGSVDGLCAFAPARITQNRYSPPVSITEVRVIGSRPRADYSGAHSAVDLRPADRLLTLRFAALDFDFPKRNRYAYSVDGLTKGWTSLEGEREVTFSDLRPGRYVFRVRASNSDGLWSEGSQAALPIVVHPPFWDTLWFRALPVALIAALILGAHRLRVRALRRDLRQRAETERVLRVAEEKYRALVENLGDAIYSADEAGTLTYLSPVAERILGASAATWIGQPLERIIGARGMAEVTAAIRTATGDLTVFCEFQPQTGRTDPRWLRASTRLLFDGWQLIGMRGVLTDITEVRRLEAQVRQSQKMDAIGQLAGGIAHDFNNLLTAIITYTDLLLGEHLPEESRREGLTEIRAASQRAATLTKQLLAFSRQQVLQPQVIDWNLLLREMERMLQRLIGENILLNLTLDSVPAMVCADPGQLQQIVFNLAINARDAMPSGGRLSISTGPHRGDTGQAEIVLTVADSGTGMTDEVKARLFEPFFTTKAMGKGTGLGLSTVYGIVRQSGGRVEVSSGVGSGTVFHVYLPHAGAAAAAAKPELAVSCPPGIGTLLVVEDNEVVFGVLRKLLHQAAAEVLFATSGEDALAQCERRQKPIDLLMTDVVMPGRTGPELADELKRRYPKMRVLFMSGYADEVLGNAGEFDAGHFLQKPFTQDELFRGMHAVMTGEAPD